jgi:hypothetical protein
VGGKPSRSPGKVSARVRPAVSALDRARYKGHRRLVPLVFLSYVIAYINTSNVAIAKITVMPGTVTAVGREAFQ